MSTFRVIIKKGTVNKDNKSLVYIIYRHKEGTPVKFSTGVKVDPKYFFPNKQDNPIGKGQQGYTSMNIRIKEVKDKISEVLTEIRLQRISPKPWLVKQRYNTQEENKPKTADFYELFKQWIEENEGIKSKHTTKTYKLALRNLTDFSKRLRLDGITRKDQILEQLQKKHFKKSYSGKPTRKYLRIMKATGLKSA